MRVVLTLALAIALTACGASPPPLRTSEAKIEGLWAGRAISWLIRRNAKRGFDKYDLDRDGFVRRDDVPFLFDETFKGRDKDGDGRLSYAEAGPSDQTVYVATQVASGVLRGVFRRLDRDGDGRLSPFELAGDDIVLEDSPSEPLSPNDFVSWLDREDQAPAPAIESDKPPVFFVPGYFNPALIFVSLKRKLKKEGYTQFSKIEHFPSLGDIREYAAEAKYEIARLRERTGAPKVEVIAFSLGGLVLRYYIKNLGGQPEVNHYVSFATPHHGTQVARLVFGLFMSNRQMTPGSEFLTELNAGDETPGDIPYTSIRSGTDEIVIPRDSAILDGAENHYIRYSEHLYLLFHPEAQRLCLEALRK